MLGVLPAPSGQDLALTIECTSDPAQRFGNQHCVRIRPDWTVETPHDLEAERIARAFGGWSTCLVFAERAVPALRRSLHYMTDPTWLVQDEVAQAVRTDSPDLPGLRRAVREEIKPDRILPASLIRQDQSSQAVAVERELYAHLFLHAGRQWAAAGNPHQIVGGEAGFLNVWNDGILPSLVDERARTLPRGAWPLSPQFYARAHFGPINIDWLIGAIHYFPTRDFAEWAVTQDFVWRGLPLSTVGRMYELGLSAQDAIGALEQRVDVETLSDLASRPAVGGPTASRWLAIWAQLGVKPTAAHYDLLAAQRVILQHPPLWILESTARALQKFGPDVPDRTELAVMLALTSDVKVIETAIRRGIRIATDDRFLVLISRENSR